MKHPFMKFKIKNFGLNYSRRKNQWNLCKFSFNGFWEKIKVIIENLILTVFEKFKQKKLHEGSSSILTKAENLFFAIFTIISSLFNKIKIKKTHDIL